MPSRVASLAVPSGEHDLQIAAAYGYPVALVEHVRIPVGSGIIGTVYEKRKPLCVADVTSMPAMQSRVRYRTNSFVALPVVAGSEALGVVCLTDRLDGRPFTRVDVTVLRRLIAPAALALVLDRTRREAESYAYAAVSDPVSGLFNRLYFQMRLEEELQRSERTGAPLALLMVDLDDFKLINDRFGHVIGDHAIRVAGDLLRRCVRVFDVCTRFGGDEFAVVMPGSGIDDAVRVAERIRQRIEAFRFDQSHLTDLRLTVSVGASVAQGTSARELIERADSALYVAKRGKNRVSTGEVHLTSAPGGASPTMSTANS
ncbi:MAG: hypothetical protein A3F70_12615 [Acidobacteria bacterium RIFCSPLOWO2_12_FULL_67_14]|nr:MAG: hypothetical protein A3F70_12615 [Acidobacteria bacterium RIFCSPLOWO2_12_FULL_67_14]